MIRSESARIVAAILAACPGQSNRLDEHRQIAMVDTFATLLADLTYAEVNAAVTVLLQISTWMPSVADIRRQVLELQRGPVRAGGEAWGDFLDAVGRHGAYRLPAFADPLVARVVSRLGWRELCLSENQVADRARFVELYDRLAQQEAREEQAPLLGEAKRQRQLEARDGSLGSLIAGLLPRGDS